MFSSPFYLRIEKKEEEKDAKRQKKEVKKRVEEREGMSYSALAFSPEKIEKIDFRLIYAK